MKKNLLIGCLLLALLLAGCAGCTTQTSPNGDKQPNAAPPVLDSPAARLLYLTQEQAAGMNPGDQHKSTADAEQLREIFFDLAQQDRWDFMPTFAAAEGVSETPATEADLGDYLYLILAQAIVWESYGNIDHEQTPEKLSAAYVHEYIKTHFGVEMPVPEPGYIYRLDFDGEYYHYPAASWREQPVWELANLSMYNDDGRMIYAAAMLEYTNIGDSIEYPPENARELIAAGKGLPEPFAVTAEYNIQFYFNADNEIVYLSKQLYE